MSLGRGIELFAGDAEEAAMKEFRQFKDKDVLRPQYANALSALEKQEALRLIMTIKEKRNGKIKGRACADGRSLRWRVRPQDATSPTVSTEAFLMSLAIDAHERRVVKTCDIPGAYLHCEMDEKCHVLLEGVMVDLYLKIDPSAKDKVIIGRKGKKRLYTLMHKALYGHMRSGRLFWENISGKLGSMGFRSNPDDLCVMNKDIGGGQFTIVLHVDDLKLSFVREDEINAVLMELEKEYGTLDVQEGPVLEYLGLTLNFATDGVTKVSATSYIDRAIELYGKSIKRGARTPAAVNLFNVREGAELLDEHGRKTFHSVFATLLWVGTMARPDILVALSFLGKRVTKADVDDEKKLERLLSYMRETRELPLTLGIDGLQIIKWWADSSFAVHKDLKSHSGLLGSFGRGAVFARSVTQKLNTTSSTESEVVAGAEVLGKALWTTSFLRNQGYNVRNALVHQDNQAAILLQTNGVMSRKKRSRHIDVRFFFMKDRIEKGDVEVVFCGTRRMIADYLTKPLQGHVFREFRDDIMGIRPSLDETEGVCWSTKG